MRAAFYDRQGPAGDVLKLGELDTPQPAPGEVLVRVHASGCNPSDVKLRAGSRPMGAARIIPHSDGAGVITSVGAGVDPSRVGQRVWLWNAQWQRPFGTCAEYIAIAADQAMSLPDTVSFAQGACLGIPAMTACRCVFADGSVAGRTVLISGGAGSVARYAIQMAKIDGARVISTASSPEKAEIARAAGADHVVDYRCADAARQIQELTGGIDHAVELEFGANADLLAAVMRQNGTIAAYGSAADPAPTMPFMPMMFKDLTLRMVLVYVLTPEARADTLARLGSFLETGQLSHAVAAEFPLDRTAEAHELVESAERRGTVVVTP